MILVVKFSLNYSNRFGMKCFYIDSLDCRNVSIDHSPVEEMKGKYYFIFFDLNFLTIENLFKSKCKMTETEIDLNAQCVK